MNSRIRLFLIDDHLLFRESLSRMLASENGFEVAGQCAHSAAALQALQSSAADVALLGSNREIETGQDFVSSARSAGYQGKLLLVPTSMDPMEALRAVQLGASGVFFQHNSAGSLAQAIRLVASGEVWLDRRIIEFLAHQVPARSQLPMSHQLSEREEHVLQGVFDGHTNRRIAESMGVSEGTVKATLQQLFRKMGVRTRSQLVRAAVETSTPTARSDSPGR